MIRFSIYALVTATLAALLLLQLTDEMEVAAWEVLLLVVLIGLLRLTPKKGPDDVPPLFGQDPKETSHAPRSVASFELAAVHAFSESPGADRRLKVFMNRIAGHRLRKQGIRPGSPRSGELIDPILFTEGRQPLTGSQIERIVDQMERI